VVLRFSGFELDRARGRGTGGDGKGHDAAARLKLANVLLPAKNASAAFLAAGDRLGRAFVAAGLPER
jgi:hypothetical protein